jgi:hypothetical protein
MSLWKKIRSSFVHGAAVKVSDAFVKIFGKDAAHQFAQGTLALLKTAEGKIVLDAVEAVHVSRSTGQGSARPRSKRSLRISKPRATRSART